MVLATIALAVSACERSPAPVPMIAPPPGAKTPVEEGAYDATIANQELNWLRAIRQGRDVRFETRRMTLPRGGDWSQVCGYYRAALGAQWQEDRETAGPASRPPRTCAWRRGRQIYAVALIEGLPADFDVLIVAEAAH